MPSHTTHRLLAILVVFLSSATWYAYAADCKVAIVGSPYNDCFDIYTAAHITAAQFASYNPGLNCSLLQLGQSVCISPGTLPSNAPSPFPNGTCATYTTTSGDSCSSIATKFHITVNNIETWNANTYKWKGCDTLQVDFTMCVSSGKPPPIPVNPKLECGPESPGNATCPLNACCSAFGFCGLTDEFCSTSGPNPCISHCSTPSLPSCNGSGFKRNVGYWESWAARRPCGAYTPSQADWSNYTHAHFAFATITQNYELLIADEDKPLLDEMLSVKQKVPGLKVILAVGGWAFSEADPTSDLFSLMISSSSTRATFISSVKSALSTHGLDGIDVDFEYPGAVERNAPATDTPNLTAFFSELRSALPSAVISVAAPAGYWFLKGFEIDKIAAQVTYINMMSYDYHGPWDTNVTGQAPVANPDTSILDMRDSALLYVRAGIDLSKANLGLAWYGRTYHLADASCKGYNCTMTGGGAPGACSNASGVLTQFEVLEFLQQGYKPTLDRSSETYWFDDSNADLVTFDQADTWAAKQTFAKNACFGGSFVWSLDQIAQNGTGTGGSSPPGSYNLVPWNPNPYPPSSAVSETFVAGGSTVVVAVPTTTKTITVGGNQIVLGPGGTPLNSLLPPGVTQPGAVTPTWSLTYHISPPSAAATVTFTAPLTGFPTYSSAVQVPTSSGAPPRTVIGPPGDTNCSQWHVDFGPSINGCLPADVGISGGTTPTAVPPRGWTGPWTAPVPPFSVTTVGAPTATYSYILWNPNPFPPPGATSETFVRSSSTTVIPIPIATTSIVLGNETIIVGPGGTPVNTFFPPDITIVSASTPTWTYGIQPPPGVSSIEFTAPLTGSPTYSSTVPVPTSPDDPGNKVSGPPGDHSPCGSQNIWTVLFGGALQGCLPLDVGIPGGITPWPLKPLPWTGTWLNPYPLATGPPEDGNRPTSTPSTSSPSSTSSSTTTSTTTTVACLAPTPSAYNLPADPENQDWQNLGTDPDTPQFNSRRIGIAGCPNLVVTSPTFVNLEEADRSVPYYHVPETDSVSTILETDTVSVGAGRPDTGMTIQEHIFELGYIKQFFRDPTMANADCTWIENNIFTNRGFSDGTQTVAAALIAAIDNFNNLVWADVPMNQAKSNVVNKNRPTAAAPPQQAAMDYIGLAAEFADELDIEMIWMLEAFIRSFAALGDYFDRTSNRFNTTATQVQQILAWVTPDSVIDDTNALPTLFYNWLRKTLQAYPNGCTSRATNVFNYYKRTMAIAAARQGLLAVPNCFDFYWQPNIDPSSFNYRNLLPPQPDSAPCHVPGSKSQVRFASDTNAWTDNVPYTVMGAGSIYYYAIGSGASIRDTHWQYEQIASPACNEVYRVMDEAFGSGTTVGLSMDCEGGTATPVRVLDVNNPDGVDVLDHCDLIVQSAPPGGFQLICGNNQTSVHQCSSDLSQIIITTVYIQNVAITFH